MVRQTCRQAGRWASRQADRQRKTKCESDRECVPASLDTFMCTVQTSTHDSRWQLIPIVQIVRAKLSTGQDFGGQWCLAIVRTLHLLAFTHTVSDPVCIETLLVAA